MASPTTLPYVVVKQSTADAIPSLLYQGDQSIAKDENGCIWDFDGTTYYNVSAAIAALQAAVLTLQGGTPSGIPVAVSGSPPAVSGTAASGNTLSGSHGGYTNAPTSWRGRYRRVGVVMPATEAIVTGTTLVTYIPTDADKGLKLQYGEFARNATGESTPEVFSAEVIVAGGVQPDYTAAGSIPPGFLEAPGLAAGAILHADDGVPGVGNVDPRLAVRKYFANDVLVADQSGSTFNSAGYSKKTIQYEITAANSAFTGVPTRSAGYYVS
jgi:hypothetical protein